MKSMLKDAGILFAITLVAGLLLGCVYQITKEPIARQEALAQENACREVFSDAESFEAVTDFTEEAAQTVLNEGGYSAASVNACQEAKDASGTVLGYVLTVTTHEGYGGDIQFTVGVRNDGTLNGISLLSISETAGLGMQAGDILVPHLDLLFDYLINKKYADIPIFDFGQSTENSGYILNENLIFQKEGFGGRGVMYNVYEYTIE